MQDQPPDYLTVQQIEGRNHPTRAVDDHCILFARYMPYRKVRAVLEERFRLATGGATRPAVTAETAQPRLQLGRKRRKAPNRQRSAK
jgi:hypothetical protein